MITKVKTNHGIYLLRNYRGFVIEAFDNAQLGDSACKGRSYSIYRNEADRAAGVNCLNNHEAIYTLTEAKSFVHSLSA